MGHPVPGAVEEEGSRAGVQMGNAGHALQITGGAAASVSGERNWILFLPVSIGTPCCFELFNALCVQGVKRCSPVTGCEEFYYPPWRRRVFRWLVSLPICILCLCFVFLVMLICFELQVRFSLLSCYFKCSSCVLRI